MAVAINRNKFFDNFPKKSLDNKALNDSRKEGFNAIFDAWDKRGAGLDVGGLAYAFATAWHETGAMMQPVREGFAKTDAGAVAAVTAFCKRQGIKNYAERQPNGKSYYGRGYVQLTFADNYKKMGKTLGFGDDLFNDPDKVLDPEIGADILVAGMIGGLFRPAKGKLSKYFSPATHDWVEARELINGDKKKNGQMIANYAKGFFAALTLASTP
jgi:predicted chitinase